VKDQSYIFDETFEVREYFLSIRIKIRVGSRVEPETLEKLNYQHSTKGYKRIEKSMWQSSSKGLKIRRASLRPLVRFKNHNQV